MVQCEQFTTPVDAVISRMRALDQTLPTADGVAVFNRVYLTVTEAVDRRIDSGHFEDARAATSDAGDGPVRRGATWPPSRWRAVEDGGKRIAPISAVRDGSRPSKPTVRSRPPIRSAS
ncbi:hypothetical protein SALBM311S_05229 [Streptomyces alboniger]